MNQILIAINRPISTEASAQQQWRSTVEKCEIQAKNMGISGMEQLGQGAWLIVSESGLPLLGVVISLAQEDGYPCRLALVDKSFSWQYTP
jgi:hypothetical protein